MSDWPEIENEYCSPRELTKKKNIGLANSYPNLLSIQQKYVNFHQKQQNRNFIDFYARSPLDFIF